MAGLRVLRVRAPAHRASEVCLLPLTLGLTPDAANSCVCHGSAGIIAAPERSCHKVKSHPMRVTEPDNLCVSTAVWAGGRRSAALRARARSDAPRCEQGVCSSPQDR